MEPCWIPKIANFGIKNGAHVATQHESMLVVNMDPTWSHVGPQKNRPGAGPGPPRPSQDGCQLGPQKIIFLRPKLTSILGGVLAALGRHRAFFGRPKRLPITPSKMRSLKHTFKKQNVTKMYVYLIFEGVLGRLLGLQKTCSVAPQGRRIDQKRVARGPFWV